MQRNVMQKRIVSLIASSTEILCALGFEEHLVGRSHECDFPPSVKKLPRCTEPKFNVEGTSYEIDQRVKAILQEGLSVYRVHAETLKALKPDLIVTQIQCQVCAVSEKDVEAAVCEVIDSRPQIISLKPDSLKDFWEDIRRVALALEVPERGEKLVASLRRRMEAIKEKVQVHLNETGPVSVVSPGSPRSVSDGPAVWRGAPSNRATRSRVTVAFIEWIDPLMAGGNWIPELVEKAGGINLFGKAGLHSPRMKWEELVAKDPEVIVVSPCGFEVDRTEQEMSFLTQKPEWPHLKAVKNKKVFLADGNQYFSRPGPRLVESLEMLAEIFYPEIFHFGHEGKGWIKFTS